MSEPIAIMDGLICEREAPTKYENSVLTMPERYRNRLDYNRWVKVVSVGKNAKEDILPGDKVYIGINAGTCFTHEGKRYVQLFARDPLAVERS